MFCDVSRKSIELKSFKKFIPTRPVPHPKSIAFLLLATPKYSRMASDDTYAICILS